MLEPTVPVVAPDGAEVAGAAVVVPVTPPTVLGVLVDGFVAGVWPAILASPVALLLLCGALDAFSPVAAAAEAFVLELAAPVWLLGAPGVVVLGLVDADVVA
ncbi:MAG TPA: hypothetical protein VG498_03540 [Terriglobales bacterium]|nr:hypothetical protein [Terriglobales bacterium]